MKTLHLKPSFDLIKCSPVLTWMTSVLEIIKCASWNIHISIEIAF